MQSELESLNNLQSADCQIQSYIISFIIWQFWLTMYVNTKPIPRLIIQMIVTMKMESCRGQRATLLGK